MTLLVVLTVIEIVVLIAALAFYLFWVGTLLARIAGNLEECAEIVRGIVADAALIGPGVEHINETGGVVAGALPLLYGMAEEIVADVTPRPEPAAVPEPARPASGTRRSRLTEAVGFTPRLSRTGGGASPAYAADDPGSVKIHRDAENLNAEVSDEVCFCESGPSGPSGPVLGSASELGTPRCWGLAQPVTGSLERGQ